MLTYPYRAASAVRVAFRRNVRQFSSTHRSINNLSQASGKRQHTNRDVLLFGTLVAVTLIHTTVSESEKASSKHKREICLDEEKFSNIIVGGGTAGCTVAYLTAKWMQFNNIPGTVLLIDRGVDFFDAKNGPNPYIKNWFENWGSFGEAHPSEREDGSMYPVTGSDHKGVGGCGTHDTRITFQVMPETVRRFAELMGWTEDQILQYYQAALNIMPLTRAIPEHTPEAFYEAVQKNLPADMLSVEHNEHKARVNVNSLAEVSVACYPNEVRWTSAYLLHDSVRPSNLKVLPHAVVDRVVLEKRGETVVATGVVVRLDADAEAGAGKDKVEWVARLDEKGEIALTGGAFGTVSVLQRSGVGPRAVLEAAGVREVFVDNPEVGHGVDHPEIGVLYEWLDKWNTPEGELPRGGVMGWPLSAFLHFLPEHQDLFTVDPVHSESTDPESAQTPPATSKALNNFVMGHFGAGLCEPYTEFPTVVCTPNCPRPDLTAGYRAQIVSTQPEQSLRVVHAEQRQDWETMAQGVYAAVRMFDHLQAQGIVGKRLEPPFDVTPANSEQLVQWIRENHFTVFHWACTCKAGLNGAVADAHFRVRSANNPQLGAQEKDDNGVVLNLRVGSAASLPEMPDANPHLTITAFSFALAEELVRAQAARHQLKYTAPVELRRAEEDLNRRAADQAGLYTRRQLIDQQQLLQVRRHGEESPNLVKLATEHYEQWIKEHPEDA